MKILTFLLLGILTPLAAQNRIHVDISAGAGGDGTTWATAYTSLQDALTAADLSVGDDEIWVAAGTYTPDPGGTDKNKKFQLLDGVGIYGGFGGTEVNLVDRNPDPSTNGTVLSGDLAGDDSTNFTNRTDNSYRVVDSGIGFANTDVDNTAVLSGFTIRGGAHFSSGGGLGGTGSPLVEHCRFIDNQSGYAGGAVGLASGATPIFSDCDFLSNTATSFGGAVDCNASPARFIRCRFEDNSSGDRGGAVLSFASALHFAHCSFRGNVVTNAAFGGSGTGAGGAVYFWETSVPIVHNCEFAGNQGIFGGAIYIFNAQPVFTNTTISGNYGTNLGGGIYNGQSGAPQLTNCVVWNNASDGSSTSLAASIQDASGAIGSPTFSHSIVQHSGGSSSWDPATGFDSGSNQEVDPLFTTPLDPVTAPSTAGDFTPGAGSPAIDAGLDSADLDGAGSGTDTIASISEDLAGNSRFEGSTVDIGAYEFSVAGGLTSFATLFPALSVGGDENQNGRSNFLDYALGADPSAADDPDVAPSISGTQVTFTHRGGTSDVTPVYKKSSTLSGWTVMQPGIDYNVISSNPVGDRIVVTLGLIVNPVADTRLFFVQDFPEP